MTDQNSVITVSGLSVVFSRRNRLLTFSRSAPTYALDNISFSIEPGSTLGIVGESGSGKTTLARAILGLVERASGDVQFPANIDSRRDIQFVFQDPLAALNPRMTVEQLITEPLDYRETRIDKKLRQEKLKSLMGQVGLDYSQRQRYAHEFSGGQCQRIGIARAMITEPKILICDEPVSALDVSVRAQIINLLKEFQQRLGLTLIFIAHDLSLVRFISDRLLVLYQGLLMETGDTDVIFKQPGHPYTRALIDAEPRPDPKLERQRKPVEYGDPGLARAGSSECVYAGRCAHVQNRCKQQQPGLEKVSESQSVACFFPLESPSSV
jgi:oligopeptide transport system ATP-binding protein